MERQFNAAVPELGQIPPCSLGDRAGASLPSIPAHVPGAAPLPTTRGFTAFFSAVHYYTLFDLRAWLCFWNGCADGQGVDAGRNHRLRQVPADPSQGKHEMLMSSPAAV
jgi:hypothetical protein